MKGEIEESLWELGIKTIEELEVERGILASGRTEIFGCIFGRDSLLTSLSLLRIAQKNNDMRFMLLIKKVLQNLAALQGTEVNIESGEEPGKCIHEYRISNHEHLTGLAVRPWFLYHNKEMRNYDSVDSTPLFLMATHTYFRITDDQEFLKGILPAVKLALSWLVMYGDSNKDGFIDYRFDAARTYGGLEVQSWMDSESSVFYEKKSGRPAYPIAPVEVQAYAYAALRAWSDFFSTSKNFADLELAAQLGSCANNLKELFNEIFVLRSPRRRGKFALAAAIDGTGEPLTSVRSSMGHCLWALYTPSGPMQSPDIILDTQYIEPLVRRLMARDLFVPHAGVRTLSSRSSRFDPGSYHNGSIWPHDTAMFSEGLENFGYYKEAAQVREALLAAYKHFKTPIELFSYTRGGFREYIDERGQGACRTQAWSAGALLSVLGTVPEALKNE